MLTQEHGPLHKADIAVHSGAIFPRVKQIIKGAHNEGGEECFNSLLMRSVSVGVSHPIRHPRIRCCGQAPLLKGTAPKTSEQLISCRSGRYRSLRKQHITQLSLFLDRPYLPKVQTSFDPISHLKLPIPWRPLRYGSRGDSKQLNVVNVCNTVEALPVKKAGQGNRD